MALAGNGRWCYLDPKLGAMHAVAEAARKVACTGATPVAATNCLNFGNPEKPEIMAQLSLAIDGIAEACTALNTPVTGGNVSLYNETRGEGIYPTPVIGVVGILEDVTKTVPSGSFQQVGDAILMLFPRSPLSKARDWKESQHRWLQEFGSSEYAKTMLGTTWGRLRELDLDAIASVNKVLVALAEKRLLHSASDDQADGGTAVTIARCSLANNIGAEFHSIDEQPSPLDHVSLFLELPGAVIITCALENEEQIIEFAKENGTYCSSIGRTVSEHLRAWDLGYETALTWSIADLRAAFSQTLESQLAAEVVTRMTPSPCLDLSFLESALRQFATALDEFKTEPARRANRDSVVIHFLLTWELSIQAIKRYLELESIKSSELPIISFQTLIRRADALGISFAPVGPALANIAKLEMQSPTPTTNSVRSPSSHGVGLCRGSTCPTQKSSNEEAG